MSRTLFLLLCATLVAPAALAQGTFGGAATSQHYCTVQVVNADGPAANAKVALILAGGGQRARLDEVTDANGKAKFSWTLNADAGQLLVNGEDKGVCGDGKNARVKLQASPPPSSSLHRCSVTVLDSAGSPAPRTLVTLEYDADGERAKVSARANGAGVAALTWKSAKSGIADIHVDGRKLGRCKDGSAATIELPKAMPTAADRPSSEPAPKPTTRPSTKPGTKSSDRR